MISYLQRYNLMLKSGFLLIDSSNVLLLLNYYVKKNRKTSDSKIKDY